MAPILNNSFEMESKYIQIDVSEMSCILNTFAWETASEEWGGGWGAGGRQTRGRGPSLRPGEGTEPRGSGAPALARESCSLTGKPWATHCPSLAVSKGPRGRGRGVPLVPPSPKPAPDAPMPSPASLLSLLFAPFSPVSPWLPETGSGTPTAPGFSERPPDAGPAGLGRGLPAQGCELDRVCGAAWRGPGGRPHSEEP